MKVLEYMGANKRGNNMHHNHNSNKPWIGAWMESKESQTEDVETGVKNPWVHITITLYVNVINLNIDVVLLSKM